MKLRGAGLALIMTLLLTGAFALGIGGALPRTTQAAPRTGALLRVGDGATSVYTVAPGSALTVPVVVEGAAGLGAATVLLTYDPAVVQVTACTAAEPAGVDISVCNPTFAAGVVRYVLVAGAGLNGNQRLFSVTFRVRGAVGAVTRLALTTSRFVDTLGVDLPVTVTGGAIAIAGAPLAVDATVRLTPQHTDIVRGQNRVVAVSLTVTDVRPLGAATFLLQYDPQVVRPVQCVRAADSPLLGSCNPNFNLAQGLIKFNVLAGEGASGSLPMYDVTFEVAAIALTGAKSPLTLTVQTMVDTARTDMNWQTEEGSITVRAGAAFAARIAVANFSVSEGEILSVPVWIANVANLGAATIALAYDPGIVRPLRCIVNQDLGDGGYCKLQHGYVVANIIAGQGITSTEAQQAFQAFFTPLANAAGGTNTPLTLDVLNFSDPRATPLPWRVLNGSILIAPGESPRPLVSVAPGLPADPLPLAQDGEVTVTVNISGAANLGAATMAVGYDPAVVTGVSCRPVDAFAGAFDGATCFMGSDAITTSLMVAAGYNGSTPVVDLVFRAAPGANIGDQSDLRLAVTNFSDTAAKLLPFRIANSALVITEPVGTPAQVTVHLDRAGYEARPGERFWVSLQASLDSVALPHGLAAAAMLLHYDPAVVRPVACSVDATSFQLGACNLAYGADRLRLSATGGTGVTGTVAIAAIQFEAIGQPGAFADLLPAVEQLLAVGGMVPTHRTAPARVWISTDGDGVPDQVEAGAPNQGDGNGDGIPDGQQAQVTSLPNGVDGGYLTLVAPPGACLKYVHFAANPAPADTPYGWAFPLGFIDFTLGCIAPGSTATVTLLHQHTGPPLEQFYLYAPGLASPASGWQPFLLEDEIGAEFAVGAIHLHLADGQRGDGDAAGNGAIVFLGAPAHRGAAVRVAPATLSAVEGGAPASYRVTLLARPASPVTIAISTTGQTTVAPELLYYSVDNWSVAQTVAVSAVDDQLFEETHQDAIWHTVASPDGLYDTLVISAVVVTITDNDTYVPGSTTVHLPLVSNLGYSRPGALYVPFVVRSPLPDLTVVEIRWGGGLPQIVIANTGAAPVVESFWVDLYIEPHTVPTAVNQTWDRLGQEGLVWGVEGAALPLEPGARLVLAVDDGYYWPSYSLAAFPLAPGRPLYVQVDSYHDATGYGAVLEVDEEAGEAYNNVFGPVVAPAAGVGEQAGAAPRRVDEPGSQPLPSLPVRSVKLIR